MSSTRGALAQLPPLARRDGTLGGVRVHAPSSGAVYARRLALAARAARLVGGAELGALGGALRLPLCRSRSSSSSRAATSRLK